MCISRSRRRFFKKRCKGTAFCAHSQINCTKSADLCTLWPICAINLDGN